jgi:hypothetical protein
VLSLKLASLLKEPALNFIGILQCCGSRSGIRCLFDPGMGKKSGSGSAMNNPYYIFESLKPIFWVKILEFFDVDPGSEMEKSQIRDPG